MRQKLIEYSLNQYMQKKVSLGKATEIAGISIREMLDILNEKGIPLHISHLCKAGLNWINAKVNESKKR